MKEETIQCDFGISAQEFFGKIFTVEFANKSLKKAQNTNIEVTDWELIMAADGTPTGKMKRTMTYDYPLTMPLPSAVKKMLYVDSVHTIATEIYTKLPDGSLQIEVTSELSGAPVVGYLKISADYLITPHPEGGLGGCHFTIKAKFECSGMPGLNGMVESSMGAGVIAGYEDFLKTVSEETPPLTPPKFSSKE